MGKDYRHNNGKKSERFDDDYDSRKRKLKSYDRNKGRKNKKLNLNQIDVHAVMENDEYYESVNSDFENTFIEVEE